MTAILNGVRVVEVAEHTFVPAASALLADWGAEVIKIEHVDRGDADARPRVHRASRSCRPTSTCCSSTRTAARRASASTSRTPDGLDILYKLAATADVFLTNKLPSVREKLKIDVDDIRAHNPNIIYVRGTGQGERGPTPTRARTTPSRSGPAPASRSARSARSTTWSRSAGARLRRLDRRDDDRRRDHGRAVPSRAHRRSDRRRRLAARHRPVGHGSGDRRSRSCSTCLGAARRRAAPQPARRRTTRPRTAVRWRSTACRRF